MSRLEQLERVCREHGILAVYLFGSRADDGLRLLRGEEVAREGSDLDIGVVFPDGAPALGELVAAGTALAEVFAPLRADVVALQRLDALFQADAIDGHRVAALDGHAADSYELLVMRKAAELVPIQRAFEIEVFGFSNR
jgi:predicted nucleotidyltransferase